MFKWPQAKTICRNHRYTQSLDLAHMKYSKATDNTCEISFSTSGITLLGLGMKMISCICTSTALFFYKPPPPTADEKEIDNEDVMYNNDKMALGDKTVDSGKDVDLSKKSIDKDDVTAIDGKDNNTTITYLSNGMGYLNNGFVNEDHETTAF